MCEGAAGVIETWGTNFSLSATTEKRAGRSVRACACSPSPGGSSGRLGDVQILTLPVVCSSSRGRSPKALRFLAGAGCNPSRGSSSGSLWMNPPATLQLRNPGWVSRPGLGCRAALLELSGLLVPQTLCMMEVWARNKTHSIIRDILFA